MVNSEVLLLTQNRLVEWGRWCHLILTSHLQITGQSLLARLKREGGIIIPGTCRDSLPRNPRAEEVNEAIEQLALLKPQGAGKPHWAKVLRIHYTLVDRDETFRLQVAKVKRPTYYRHLSHAKNWIAQSIMIQS